MDSFSSSYNSVKNRFNKRISFKKYGELVEVESKIGASIFRKTPEVIDRKFFNLNASTWMWYELVKKNRFGGKKEIMVRYEIKENGVLKVSPNLRYEYIKGQELDNFLRATEIYYRNVLREIYAIDPDTGKAIV